MNRDAFTSLTMANGRELVRDRKTAAANILLPIFYLALFVALSLLIDPDREKKVINFALPVATFFVLGSIALPGAVVPVVELRRRGTLRLLSTTPLRRSTFLLSLAPIRLAIAAVFIALAIAISGWFDLLQIERIPMIVAICVGGLAFLVTLGFLIAARLDSSDAANNILTFVIIFLILIAGGLGPLSSLPGGLRAVIEWLPPTMMLDSLREGMVGASPRHPGWLSLLVLLGTSAVLAVLAVRAFRWDRSSGD